ncbi:hypothetical protein OIU79_008533 [Salix purpurea]|uniref:Uncharacterized protein n=1 Tax=Salix purpurea TaxID=77065 RepID=A0A9Q0YW53_SALPP|nr:hypothetical protein OIU79_008533 [Salix purpurea]
MWEDLKLDKSILLETQPCLLLYQQEEGLNHQCLYLLFWSVDILRLK